MFQEFQRVFVFLVDVAIVGPEGSSSHTQVSEMLSTVFDSHLNGSDYLCLVTFNSQSHRNAPRTIFSLVTKEINQTQLKNNFIGNLAQEPTNAPRSSDPTSTVTIRKALKQCRKQF